MPRLICWPSAQTWIDSVTSRSPFRCTSHVADETLDTFLGTRRRERHRKTKQRKENSLHDQFTIPER